MALTGPETQPRRFASVVVTGRRGARVVLIDGREIPGVLAVNVADAVPDTGSQLVTIRLESDDVTVTSPIAHERRAVGDGEDDAEVWIPPRTDCEQHRPGKPCPHCRSEYWHARTGRCSDCGRRP
jgi:hypothetical protein